MRVIQNAALFGLISGTGLLFFGMMQGSTAIGMVGAGLGLMIGVPAAYLHFALQGMDVFKGQGVFGKILADVRERFEQRETKPTTAQTITPFHTPNEQYREVPITIGSKLPEPEVIRPEVVVDEVSAPPPPAKITPQPEPDEAIAIPVRVIPTETPETQAEAILAEVLPDPVTEPQPVGLSDAERRAIIDDIEAATSDNIDELLELAVHKDTLVRLYAVQKLGDLGDPSVETTLDAAYTDDDEIIIRRAARLSLNKLGLEIPEIQTPAEESVSELSTSE